MSRNMWNISEIKSKSQKDPKYFVQQQCKILSDLTKGKIIGRVSEYDGVYRSEYKGVNTLNLESLIKASEAIGAGKKFDIQKKLGAGDEDERFVYEFFITSEKTSKYKYRICFLYYSILLYPVGITLEKSIADELDLKDEFKLNSEEEFIEFLEKLLSSKRVTSVISNLLILNEEVE